jgi:predicted HNH restriction endonuclease
MGMKDFDSAKWFTVYANMINSDLRKEALKLRGEVFALESKLKAAEDHAATMEACAKDAEGKCKRTLVELLGRNAKIEQLEAEMLTRVPFEVACEMCCHADTEDEEPNCNLCSKTPAPESCPLIPKVKTDD